MSFALALRLARRDLRGGLGRFRLFLACLALGVAAIAAIASVGAAIRSGLESQGGAVLGGDAEIGLVNRAATVSERAWLDRQGTVSEIAELRTMAGPPGDQGARLLVELKAVDARYPLYGAVELDPALPLGAALGREDREWGAVAEPGLLDRLGLKVGDAVQIGAQTYRIRAALRAEPDRLSGGFSLGPRLMVALGSLPATGLLRAGSLVRHSYRLALPPGTDPEAWAAAARGAFPHGGWRLRERTHAAPSLGRTLDRMHVFLILTALTALAVGGIGVGNAVATHLAAKRATIGILRALGGSRRLILTVFGAEIALLSSCGIALGLIAGALVPFALMDLGRRTLGIPVDAGPHWAALALAAGAGALVALGFTVLPLSRASGAAPSGLFRALVAPLRQRPSLRAVALVGVSVLAGAALVLLVAGKPRLGFGFLAGISALVAALWAAAWVLSWAGRWLARSRVGFAGPVRVALASLGRPGAATANVVVSLGVGLTLLAALMLISGALSREIGRLLPSGAPAFFFIDIQPDQAEAFDRLAYSIPGVRKVERVPQLRGRIVRLNGRPADTASVPERARWALRGDRGLTYAAAPPAGADIVAGGWWPPDYSGPPLISFDASLARDFGLKIGDTLTYNVLGREITGRIANLRRIDWTDLRLNFTGVFSPGILSGAPHTDVATVQCAPSAEAPLLRAVSRTFPNVTSIRVRDVLGRVQAMLRQMGLALGGASGISLLAGLLVLAGAVAAGRRARLYDSAVLHALGATRRQILIGLGLEYTVLGLAAGTIAAAAGLLAAWIVVERSMGFEMVILPGRIFAVIVLGGLFTLGFGLAGTWRALGRPAARILRAD